MLFYEKFNYMLLYEKPNPCSGKKWIQHIHDDYPLESSQESLKCYYQSQDHTSFFILHLVSKFNI
jgi:hypothetical protein